MEYIANGVIIVFSILIVFFFAFILFIVYLILFDRGQKKHSVLRNYPLLGRARYFFEKIGPELRQYWFNSDSEGKPISRDDYEHIVKGAKYKRDVIGYGAKRALEEEGYYIRNDMFPKLSEELKIDRETITLTKRYLLIKDPLFTDRVEKLEDNKSFAFLLKDEDAVVIEIGRS